MPTYAGLTDETHRVRAEGASCPFVRRPTLHSITLVDVTAGHGATEVLSHTSLTIAAGSRIGVVGPNGAGKTTLLRLLAGLEEPERGRVRLTPPGLSVGYLPQELESPLRQELEPADARRSPRLANALKQCPTDAHRRRCGKPGLERPAAGRHARREQTEK